MNDRVRNRQVIFARKELLEATPLLYRELRHLVMRQLARGNSPRAPELAQTVLRRLNLAIDYSSSHRHCVTIAARIVRHVLVERTRVSGKNATYNMGIDLLTVEKVLGQLEAKSAPTATAIELHYFGGLTVEETAAAMDLSITAAATTLRFGKAWLVCQVTNNLGH